MHAQSVAVGRRSLVLAVLVLSVLAVKVQSAPPAIEKKETPKTVKVVFVDADLHDVFAWLFEQTGKPIRSCTPNGKFTFVSPPGKESTIAEVVAAINEAF